MSKRVFELSKELNTTSKRLIEKLAEINIHVKSHMSLLNDDELERLYKHIGVVNRNRGEGSDSGSEVNQQEKTESQLVRKSIPRIIRKTEIIINDDEYDININAKEKDREKKKSRRSYVRVSSSTDGLMAGLRRERDSISLIRKHEKTAEKEQSKEKSDIDNKVEEQSKAAKEITEDTTGFAQRGERIRRPMDSILSIKKVSPRELQERMEESEAREEKIKAARDVKPDDENKTAEKLLEKKESETASRNLIDNQEEKVSAKAGTEKNMVQKAQIAQQTDTEKSMMEQKDIIVKKPAKEKIEETVSSKKEQGPETAGAGLKQAQALNADDEAAGKAEKEKTVQKAVAQTQTVKAGKADKSTTRKTGKQGKAKETSGRDRESLHRQDDIKGRDRAQGQKGRGDDKAAGSNKTLVIPKVNLIPGVIEEKTNIRGERRSTISRDLEKGFRREAKKGQPRKDLKMPSFAGSDRLKDKYKKNYAIGHTANVSDMYSDDYVINEFYEEKERLKKDKKGKRTEKYIPPKAVLQEITIPETITVKNLSEALKKTSAVVIKKLMSLGIMATINQELDFDTAAIVGDEFNVKVNKEVVITDEDILFDDMEDKEEDLKPRAPVVVVMGHVDHGKTTLLDAIRKSRVADREAGGITQHIGAYKVKVNDRDITFLDTPGHEAFTAMRARGAQATDIAILVVAADDGVMPQTVEAINHAKAANVTIIVAINKIDKPGANPDRVKQELAERGVLIEEWGGDVIAIPISAKQGTNIDQLLEMVLLTADILELKANPDRQAKGIVIEAKLDKGRGPVATLLIQRGTLRTGESIISGTTFGRIRAMTDDTGRRIESAGPSTPVEIIGLDEVPEAGDVFYAVSDEKVAKHLVEKRREEHREKSIGTAPKVSLEDLFNQIQQGNVKELNLIVKADVQGSVEALTQSFEKLSNEEVKVKVIHGGVGAVNEADVTLASVSNAIIIGFNVRPPANVMEEASSQGVDIRLYRVIYGAIEDMEKAMKGLLEPMYKEVIDGHVEIRQIFKASSVGTIGGGYVTDGKITRNSEVRVVRDGIVAYEGKLASLRRFKDDVREVTQGYECGLLIEKYNDIKVGDIIEAFRMEEVERV
ncbi:MAG: translation initiation factor IF-2 [Clostridiaceae bacterium]|nr:translation initiation factor IF-2 [Clostridiaceae bacterium]